MLCPPIKTAASQKPNTQTEQVTNVPSNSEQPINAPTLNSTNSGASVTKPKPNSTGSVYSGRYYSTDEVQQLIRDYSAQYGISANLPLRIAQCESGFNQLAKNKSSSASGVYQWLASSWANQPASNNGAVSPFDADTNIRAALWLIAHDKISPWNASRSCWTN